MDEIPHIDAIERELQQIRDRHGVRPLVTSERDAALIELASPIPSVRWRAKQIVNKSPKRKRRGGARGSYHYKYKRKASKRGVYKFYWSHQEVRRFHGWKGHQDEHVFLTLEEWIVIREAAIARKSRSWSLHKRDHNRCWTWNNVYVLIDKCRAFDPRLELERPESCPRPDLRFVGAKKKVADRLLD